MEGKSAARAIPEGIEPFSVSMANMEKLGLKNGENITDIVQYKEMDKQSVLVDCETHGFMSAFYDLRKKIEVFPEETLLIVGDMDCTYKDMCNFYWCSSEATIREHVERFRKFIEAERKEEKDQEAHLVKYLGYIRLSQDERIDTIAHYTAVGKAADHKDICESFIEDEFRGLQGEKPYRLTSDEKYDYMAYSCKANEEFLIDSQLIVVAGFGKLFSIIAEDELANCLERAFKVDAGISAEEVEGAIAHELDAKMESILQKMVDQFEDEADDPNEHIPEYEEKPLVANRVWTPLTRAEVKKLEEEGNAEEKIEKRPEWVFHTPSVDDMVVKDSRPRMEFCLSKQRRDFEWDYTFDDVEDENTTGFPRNPNENYTFVKADLDIGFQCAVSTISTASQTLWSRKVNKIEQVEPRVYEPKEIKRVLESKEILAFLKSKVGYCEHVLESNNIVDLFNDEFKCLETVESAVGNNADSNLRSMNQLRAPGMPPRKICDICWHPTVKGLIAYACGANLDFEKIVELSGSVMWTSIIIWNLSNLLVPRARLAVPGDVKCFRMNPTNPYIIVAGLATGQVIMWDLSSVSINGEDIYAATTTTEAKKSQRTPSFSSKVCSVVQVSHSKAVTDIRWLPKGVRITGRGEFRTDPDAKMANYFASTSGDGTFMFWDVRLQETHNADGSLDKNLRWTPVFKTEIRPSGAKMRLSATKFALLKSKKKKCNLAVVSSAGEVTFGSWALEPDEKGKKEGQSFETVRVYRKAHNQYCVGVLQSPHFPEICMTIGDWTFSLWKEGYDEPIFTSSSSDAYLTAGSWSPTRPGMIVIGRSDGVLDIWILIDQIHKPVQYKKVRAATEISSLSFWSGKSQQLLAVGDFTGTLHIFLVPRMLMRSANNEKEAMRDWYNHELERLNYVQTQKIENNKSRENIIDEMKGKENSADDEKVKGPSLSAKEIQAKETEYEALLKVFTDKFLREGVDIAASGLPRETSDLSAGPAQSQSRSNPKPSVSTGMKSRMAAKDYSLP